MPVHDWTRVGAGIFHDFRTAWLVEMRNQLNEGVLPTGYYALAEQIASDLGPDVLTLETTGGPPKGSGNASERGVLAVASAPPQVRFTARVEQKRYSRKQRRLVIRHSSGDRVVALIEIVSPGNKASLPALRSFIRKAVGTLESGYHLLVVDLHPPTRRDPQGMHGSLWSAIGDDSYRAPADKPLTLASYSADVVKTAYVEPIAVGDVLPDMLLFLDPEHYVLVPLEATYQAAWRGVPQRWQQVLVPAS
jgi:hypothetical protein